MWRFFLLACLPTVVSCAGLDIEGDVSAEATAAFRQFKTGLYSEVRSARVELAGERGFSIKTGTDYLDALIETMDGAVLLSAQDCARRIQRSVSILLYCANGDLYATTVMDLDPDEVRRPVLVVQYENWYFGIRSAVLASLGRRWLEVGK